VGTHFKTHKIHSVSLHQNGGGQVTNNEGKQCGVQTAEYGVDCAGCPGTGIVLVSCKKWPNVAINHISSKRTFYKPD